MNLALDRHKIRLQVFIFLLCKLCHSVEVDFTFSVDAGARECFYQKINEGATVELEYQVVEGGDLDISLVFSSPGGVVILTEIRQTDGVHRHTATETGDYVVCLDNTFSRFSQKLVFLELITDDDDGEENDNWDDLTGGEELVDVKMEVFKERMESVKKHLQKTITIQNTLRIYETQDRSVMENNFMRVNTWSGITLGVMITVGIVQVLLIRSLFDDKSKVAQIFKAKT